MATLKQTLGQAPSTQTYKYPSLPSPYPTYRQYGQAGGFGANVVFPANNPYAQAPLQTTMAQAERPVPTANFQAEYDYDPVLARIQAMGSMGLQGAKAEAESLKKQTLIDAGDVDIAKDVGADALTQEAVRQNTDVAKLSTIARLNKAAQDRAQALDEAMNVQNLFYSGARQREIGEQGQGLLQARTDFGRSLRAALAQIQSGVMDAENRFRQEQLQAALGAAGRVTGGGVPPGGGTYTPPVTGPAPPAPPNLLPGTDIEVPENARNIGDYVPVGPDYGLPTPSPWGPGGAPDDLIVEPINRRFGSGEGYGGQIVDQLPTEQDLLLALARASRAGLDL